MASLSLRNIRKSYGSFEVIRNVNLDIERGELVVFVGPSGCGKSTLLRMIAGLDTITGGDLEIDGVRMNDAPPAQRGIAMVFQSYALYPHMTVRDNMAFGLKIARKSKREIAAAIANAAEILQLTPYLDRLPKELSGGQRQRVAIGRAIVRDPKVFLFDEPLSNLDAALRVATRIKIAQLKEQMPGTTMVYVTHDQVEAMTLATRIVVLNRGAIEQVGAPLELYERPANTFVATFIGSPAMNLLPVTISAPGPESVVETLDGVHIKAPIPLAEARRGEKAQLGVRPEDLRLADRGEQGGTLMVEGVVAIVEALGEVNVLHCDLGAGREPFIAKLPGGERVARGEKVRLYAAPDKLHLFGADGLSLRVGA